MVESEIDSSPGSMDSFRPPFQPNLPPTHLNINDPPTQESSTFNWPSGFVFNPTALQQAQAARAAQAVYASFFKDQMQTVDQQRTHHPISNTPPMSSTPPHTTYYQHQFPTSPFIPNPLDVPTQTESNSNETSNVPAKVSNRKKNWRHDEDIALCEAWVRRSENPIIGNCQTGDSFWSHIFEEFCKKQPGTSRAKKGLENRRTIIGAEVTKWRGVVKNIQRNHMSGTNVADEWGACYEEFKNKHGNNFKFYHCWEILQHSPKWHISVDEKSKGHSSQTSHHVNATPPTPSPLHGFCDIGLDGLNDTGAYHVSGIHIDDNSPLPAMPTAPGPSCVRSKALKRPPGRDISKVKKTKTETQAVKEAEVRNSKLCEEVSKWRTSQDNQFCMEQETKKAQFECMKAANEVQGFELMRKTKLDQLQSCIAIVQSLGEAEEKMLQQFPNFLTPEVVAGRAARFMKLQNYARQHEEIEKLEYTPGSSANIRLNTDGVNMEPCNVEDRLNVSSDSNEQD